MYFFLILAQLPRVCFEFDLEVTIVPGGKPCGWGTSYKSVIGFGRARFVDDPTAKKEALNVIMSHYAGKSFDFTGADVRMVTIIHVDIEQMSGKCADSRG